MDWRSVFVENWPYKIAALALSVLLWFNVTADEERQDQAVPTALEFEIRDSAWVALSPLTEVTTLFQGRRREIFALLNEPVLRIVIDEVTDSVMRIPLSPGDVIVPGDLSVLAISVRPSEVELRLDTVISRTVPITADVTASAASGFALQSHIVQPDRVTITGARTEVASISGLRTIRSDEGEVDRSVRRQLAVSLPSGVATLSVAPTLVMVTVQVDSLIERRLRVPIVAVGTTQSVEIVPDSVTAVLAGAASLVRPISAEEVRAIVNVQELLDGARSLPVEVLLPEAMSTVTATSEPPIVTVAPQDDAP